MGRIWVWARVALASLLSMSLVVVFGTGQAFALAPGYTAGDSLTIPAPAGPKPLGTVKEIADKGKGVDALGVLSVGFMTYTATSWLMDATGITESDAAKCAAYAASGMGQCGDGGYEGWSGTQATSDPATWGPNWSRAESWNIWTGQKMGNVSLAISPDPPGWTISGQIACLAGSVCSTAQSGLAGKVWCSNGTTIPAGAAEYGAHMIRFGFGTGPAPRASTTVIEWALGGSTSTSGYSNPCAPASTLGGIMGTAADMAQFGLTICAAGGSACAAMTDVKGWAPSGMRMAWGTKQGVDFAEFPGSDVPAKPIVRVDRNCGATVISESSVVDVAGGSPGIGIPACPDGSVPGDVTTTLEGLRNSDGSTTDVDGPTQTEMSTETGLELLYNGLPVDSWDTRLSPTHLRDLWKTETEPDFAGDRQLRCRKDGDPVGIMRCKPIVDVLAPPQPKKPPKTTPKDPQDPVVEPTNCDGSPVGTGFDPVGWVVTPVKCALEWAFVPKTSVQTRVTRVKTAFDGTFPFGVPSLIAGFGTGVGGGCPDWEILVDGDARNVVCGSSFTAAIRGARPFLFGGMVIAGIWPLIRGLWYASVPVIKPTPNGGS